MDFLSIITAVGASGILTGLFTWLGNRRKDAAQACNSEAEYTDKIIRQANSRTAQYEADAAMFRAERDEARNELKGQRKAKQEWRDKYLECERIAHELELTIKDMQGRIMEERFHRCEVNGCVNRLPPRERSNT